MGFMGLRLYFGGTENPLILIPEEGLDEIQTGFLREKIVEVTKGKVDRGKVKDLTNFEWDQVCVFLNEKNSNIVSIRERRLKNAPPKNQKDYVYLVFKKTGIRQMTVKLKITDQFGYYQIGPYSTKCFPTTAIFYTKQKSKSVRRLLVLN